jgi:2-dehydro-3-deoxyphosphogluconate aldolase / (4S)-4-hydroxy-2-oxoglutarate aldolase
MIATDATTGLAAQLKAARILPILTAVTAAQAVPLARALLAGGLSLIEITLRSPTAIEAARAVQAEVPEAVVGLGTLLTPADVDRALAAGAHFALSPGATPALLKAAADSGLAFLPGVATASEAMQARDAGFAVQKFFPAEAAGGAGFLKGLAGPLPDLAFCPTGGIGPQNLSAYLELANVLAVGGTWLVPPAEVAARNWPAITALAAAAKSLAQV